MASVVHSFCCEVYIKKIPRAQWITNLIAPTKKKGDLSLMNSYRGINLVFICAKVYNKILLNGIQRFKDPILRRNHAKLVRSVVEDKGCKMDQGRESDGMSLGVTIP